MPMSDMHGHATDRITMRTSKRTTFGGLVALMVGVGAETLAG
jgi:hypothetical protein